MLDEAMRAACASLGIVPPARINPGKWVRTNTLERNGKGDASVLVFDDRQGGIVWNWQTQQKQTFTTREPGQAPAPRKRDIGWPWKACAWKSSDPAIRSSTPIWLPRASRTK